MSLYPYHLGCPVWASSRWAGTLYTRKAGRQDFLPQYSEVFNTVEVNSTFYALPAVETVKRWAEAVAPGFRFCLKFPRAISHERMLTNAGTETALFLELLRVLDDADCLGPSFLQLAPTFSGTDFPRLENYLTQLPTEFPYAVEVRHADYYDGGPYEASLNDLLTQQGMDRTLMDTRPLFSAPPTTETEQRTQDRKPRVPVRFTATGQFPMVRLIGRDDVPSLKPWVEEWANVVADWLRQGKTPYVFTHTPDDVNAPAFGRLFHTTLQTHLANLPSMSPWPGESEPPPQKQLRLFGDED